MADENEFLEVQEELGEIREAMEALESKNEALQEVLFALLNSLPIEPEKLADIIDRTLDDWLLKNRSLGSVSSQLLLRVRDDALAKLPASNQGLRGAIPRPALRAVPIQRRKEEALGETTEKSEATDLTRDDKSNSTPHEPTRGWHPEKDE
ncbi:MAG: hypothetical protein ACTH5D_10180 [Halomonas sp.]|uniref:hypothetical protein n=1 Tax=Halomonas sp. TaxID=1486246 RepID=UPI003F8E3423